MDRSDTKSGFTSRSSKFFVISGCLLLALMAVFHGSGIQFVNAEVTKSNTADFIKEIFPVLFIHPSIHLFGLAAFGALTLRMKDDRKKVLVMISSLIVISSLAAFYLSAILPGLLLLSAAFCFLIASRSR
ncbi:MAG: hypothetical protein AAF361_03370 [Bacteroidota bacterium]